MGRILSEIKREREREREREGGGRERESVRKKDRGENTEIGKER